MNVTELARKLKVPTSELLEKLPKLGFDIGKRAIKVDDRLAHKIISAWWSEKEKEKLEAKYNKSKNRDEGKVIEKKGDIEIPSVLTVRDFAEILKMPIANVITELMRNGVMATLNQRIDFETAAIIAEELGYTAKELNSQEKIELSKDQKLKDIMSAEKTESLQERPPVIVVMGHVDHGKTKLLDAIRTTDVVAGEAGGITQHIGAYQVHKQDRLITFIDTPGHEAFTAMRSRGAKVADITILVVAANDGVKPQTVEALKIAQDSGVPIIVAINKIDLAEANVEKTKQELSQYKLLPEDWGGKTICVPISAKHNQNIDDLLEQVLLVADLEPERLTANPDGRFAGSVIESHINKGAGPIATILVKNGTLKVGDVLNIDGIYYGKIKAMKDYKGESLEEAPPSTPVQILGFKVAPKVGDVVEVAGSKAELKEAKSYDLKKQDESLIKNIEQDNDSDNENITKLNIVLRTDVIGSQEAIIESLKKLETEDIKIKILQKGLGSITENDVLTSEASNALLIGFNVMPSTAAESLARDKKLDVKLYKIIYELIDEVKKNLKDLIKPELVRNDLGKLEVLKIFNKEADSMIIGGKVIKGKIEAEAQAAVLRSDSFITMGKIREVQSGKQVVKDVLKGQECGLRFEGKPLVEEGDILDVYKEEEVYKSL